MVVIEEDLHTMDAPFFVFRLHTIYIIVHAIQIECNENMQLLRKHAMPITCTLVHALMLASVQCLLDTCISYKKLAYFIGNMHSCWIQAVHTDCMCGVLQVKKMELCALGGRGGGDRGGPAYNGCTIICVQVAHYLYYCARNTNRM